MIGDLYVLGGDGHWMDDRRDHIRVYPGTLMILLAQDDVHWHFLVADRRGSFCEVSSWHVSNVKHLRRLGGAIEDVE